MTWNELQEKLNKTTKAFNEHLPSLGDSEKIEAVSKELFLTAVQALNVFAITVTKNENQECPPPYIVNMVEDLHREVEALILNHREEREIKGRQMHSSLKDEMASLTKRAKEWMESGSKIQEVIDKINNQFKEGKKNET